MRYNRPKGRRVEPTKKTMEKKQNITIQEYILVGIGGVLACCAVVTIVFW